MKNVYVPLAIANGAALGGNTDTSAAADVHDGQTFKLTDNQGNTDTFEFQTGPVLVLTGKAGHSFAGTPPLPHGPRHLYRHSGVGPRRPADLPVRHGRPDPDGAWSHRRYDHGNETPHRGSRRSSAQSISGATPTTWG